MQTNPSPRNPHLGRPFDATEFSDADIASALEDLSVPALLMSCVHIGSPEQREAILSGPLRPQGALINEYHGAMSDDDQAAARALALDMITSWRDRGCPEPDPVPTDLIKRMMDWIVAAEVPSEYVAMMLDDLGFEEAAIGDGPVEGASDFPVVIIGCGMSGIVAAIRLQAGGFPYVIVEKNDGPGGTWWENRYPGARVDIGSHHYSYSFEPAHHWSEYFARQPELQSYFEMVVEKYGIAEHVTFGREVERAEWDEASSSWTVTLDDGTSLIGRALISAVGQLNRPYLPDVPGEFDGPAFHTARWPEDLDLTDKDVVMIGAGATGFQIAPAIADTVRSLTVIQRSAQWMYPNPGYHDGVGDGVQWALDHLPFYGRWFRFVVFWPACDTGFTAARVDHDWQDQEHSVSEINDLARMVFTDWITSQVGDDPELLAKVLPTYPVTGKRTLQDNGSWLKTLQRPNVELVRSGVERLVSDGVVDSNGAHHPAHVVVWATGFKANDFLVPMEVVGRNGAVLAEEWGIRPRAYLGITVSQFPNLFLMYGPGTNLPGGGSIIFASECEAQYVEGCLRLLVEGGHKAMEPRRETYDEYYARSQAEMRNMVWASPHIEHNYYCNEEGEVHGVNPFRSVDYWSWTREPDPADYDLR